MGHAGAIIGGAEDTAAANEYPRECGIAVAEVCRDWEMMAKALR
jgi:hypothetical protein